MTNFNLNKTLIIGLGLLGGSIAKSLRKYNISSKIFAFDPNQESIKLALNQKIIEGEIKNFENIQQFDSIILCAPLEEYNEIFKKLKSKINQDSIFFDIGSVKDFNFQNIPKNFIGCHPIAGSDVSGFINSKDDLFNNKNFIICPHISSSQDQINIITNIIEKIQAKPIIMDAKNHDKIYGLVSHLPQFLSFLTKEFSPKNIQNIAINTAFRLDNSDPKLWQDIFKLNQNNLELFYNQFYDNCLENLENLNKLDFNKILNEQNLQNFLNLNSGKIIFDENFIEFFNMNFTKIIARFIVVLSFLKINEIKQFQSYIGQGFKDFIFIINIINQYNNSYKSELSINFNKNSQQIYKMINNIIQ